MDRPNAQAIPILLLLCEGHICILVQWRRKGSDYSCCVLTHILMTEGNILLLPWFLFSFCGDIFVLVSFGFDGIHFYRDVRVHVKKNQR